MASLQNLKSIAETTMSAAEAAYAAFTAASAEYDRIPSDGNRVAMNEARAKSEFATFTANSAAQALSEQEAIETMGPPAPPSEGTVTIQGPPPDDPYANDPRFMASQGETFNENDSRFNAYTGIDSIPEIDGAREADFAQDASNRLTPDVASLPQATEPSVHFQGPKDWRVLISLPADSPVMAGNALFEPLKSLGGVVFPYVPTITMSHKANYSPQKLVHSNYTSYSYEGSEVSEIGITGEFSVQNTTDGKYLLAVIYFFRTVTKMFFGSSSEKDTFAGNPPPLVQLNGYGKYYFPGVLCAVTNFSHTMPNDVDYVEILVNRTKGSEGKVRLPTMSTITVSLQPMYSRKHVYKNFNLKDFAAGNLLGKGGFI